MFCSKCGARLDEQSRFCNMCGAPVDEPIEDDEPVVQMPPQPQPQPVQMQPQQPVQQVQPQPVQQVQPQPVQMQPQRPVQQVQPQPVQMRPQQPVQQMPPQKSGSKGKAVLIIILAGVATFVLILVLAVLIFLRVRKHSDEVSDDRNVTTEAVDETDWDTEDDEVEEPDDATEETSEIVPADEPAPVPFAIGEGLTFVDPYQERFASPIFSRAYYVNEDGSRGEAAGPDQVAFDSTEANYSFGDFTVSEPDENGNVRILIPIDISYPDALIDKGLDREVNVSNSYRMIRLYDYYSGMQIIIPEASNLAYEMEPDYTDLEWNGTTTSVGVSLYEIWNSSDYEEAGKTDDGYTRYESQSSVSEYYVVTAPADYDGLMLVGYKEGSTEDMDGIQRNGDGRNTSVLGPDIYGHTYQNDDLYLIRVNDHLKNHVGNDYLASHNILPMESDTQVIAELMKIKNEKDTDEMLYMPTVCSVSESTEDCDPGMKKVIGYYTIDYSADGNVAFEAWVDAFDRYSGVSFMSGAPLTINSKTKATELETPITIDTPSGFKEIFMEVESKMDKKNKMMTRKITVTCPEDYDGTVFMVGYSSRALAEKLDFEDMASRKMRIDEMPFLHSGKNCFFYTLNGY